VLGWIDVVDAAGQDRDRAGGKRAQMRGRVDPPRHAGDDRVAGLADPGRQLTGETLARGRGDPRPHHRHRRAGQEL
jgi:hypothetical protein